MSLGMTYLCNLGIFRFDSDHLHCSGSPPGPCRVVEKPFLVPQIISLSYSNIILDDFQHFKDVDCHLSLLKWPNRDFQYLVWLIWAAFHLFLLQRKAHLHPSEVTVTVPHLSINSELSLSDHTKTHAVGNRQIQSPLTDRCLTSCTTCEES